MNPADPFSVVIEATSVGQRLDVLVAELAAPSRARAQALIKQGLVEINGRVAESSYRVRAGDRLTIQPAPVEEIAPAADRGGAAIELQIVFEDDALLAINKPAGLVVHPALGHRTGTLVDALLHHRAGQLSRGSGEERPGLVHRLDKDTSGLLLVAKTDEAQARLAESFAQRTVRKLYRALCWGVFRQRSGQCRGAIGRHRVHRQKMTVLKSGGREAWTDYRVLAQGAHGAEVECDLHTGRTHQIRVHLAHLHHPVWGDEVYGKPHPLPDGYAPTRQMLHAWRIEIAHPITGKQLELEAPVPPDYAGARARLLG